MTDIRTTQVSVEQWAASNPNMQVTQVAVEMWAAVATANPFMVATQFAIEQWGSVAVVPVAAGGPMVTIIQ
jgi:hypothetical protein